MWLLDAKTAKSMDGFAGASMGEVVLPTKHRFVPPNGHTRMCALGLHKAGTA